MGNRRRKMEALEKKEKEFNSEIEGFYRHWDGSVIFVLDHDLSNQTVTFAKVLNSGRLTTETIEENQFLGKINVGPVGDMVCGYEPPEYVPFASKIIGWNYFRHSGGRPEIATPFYQINPTRVYEK